MLCAFNVTCSGTDGLVDMKHISGIRTAGIRDKIKRAGKVSSCLSSFRRLFLSFLGLIYGNVLSLHLVSKCDFDIN